MRLDRKHVRLAVEAYLAAGFVYFIASGLLRGKPAEAFAAFLWPVDAVKKLTGKLGSS